MNTKSSSLFLLFGSVGCSAASFDTGAGELNAERPSTGRSGERGEELAPSKAGSDESAKGEPVSDVLADEVLAVDDTGSFDDKGKAPVDEFLPPDLSGGYNVVETGVVEWNVPTDTAGPRTDQGHWWFYICEAGTGNAFCPEEGDTIDVELWGWGGRGGDPGSASVLTTEGYGGGHGGGSGGHVKVRVTLPIGTRLIEGDLDAGDESVAMPGVTSLFVTDKAGIMVPLAEADAGSWGDDGSGHAPGAGVKSFSAPGGATWSDPSRVYTLLSDPGSDGYAGSTGEMCEGGAGGLGMSAVDFGSGGDGGMGGYNSTNTSACAGSAPPTSGATAGHAGVPGNVRITYKALGVGSKITSGVGGVSVPAGTYNLPVGLVASATQPGRGTTVYVNMCSGASGGDSGLHSWEERVTMWKNGLSFDVTKGQGGAGGGAGQGGRCTNFSYTIPADGSVSSIDYQAGYGGYGGNWSAGDQWSPDFGQTGGASYFRPKAKCLSSAGVLGVCEVSANPGSLTKSNWKVGPYASLPTDRAGAGATGNNAYSFVSYSSHCDGLDGMAPNASGADPLTGIVNPTGGGGGRGANFSGLWNCLSGHNNFGGHNGDKGGDGFVYLSWNY